MLVQLLTGFRWVPTVFVGSSACLVIYVLLGVLGSSAFPNLDGALTQHIKVYHKES